MGKFCIAFCACGSHRVRMFGRLNPETILVQCDDCGKQAILQGLVLGESYALKDEESGKIIEKAGLDARCR